MISFHPGVWVPQMPKVKVPSSENFKLCKVPTFKPGAGQNIDRCDTLIAWNSFTISAIVDHLSPFSPFYAQNDV